MTLGMFVHLSHINTQLAKRELHVDPRDYGLLTKE